MIENERGLYKPIQRWLRNQGYAVDDEWINTGGETRVDVIGIMNSGNKYYDDVEIVAVEAKIGGNVKALGQTENYKDFAHKVYFATTDEAIAGGLKKYCTQKKLGLLVVDRKTKRVNELLGAQVDKPNEARMTEFLGKLWIIKCALCGCYFDSGIEKKGILKLKRWTRFSKNKAKIRRYLCCDCVRDINEKDFELDDKYNRITDRLAKKSGKIRQRYKDYCDRLWKEIKRTRGMTRKKVRSLRGE